MQSHPARAALTAGRSLPHTPRRQAAAFGPPSARVSAFLLLPSQYIVLRGALSADAVATLLAKANERKRGGQDDRPEGFQNDQHALHWDKVYRDLIDHPLVSPILAQLCGATFRLDHVNVHARPLKLHPGQTLHGGDNPGGGNGFYGFRNGSFTNGLVSVTYELEDTDMNPAGGGFCCAPQPLPPPQTEDKTTCMSCLARAAFVSSLIVSI